MALRKVISSALQASQSARQSVASESSVGVCSGCLYIRASHPSCWVWCALKSKAPCDGVLRMLRYSCGCSYLRASYSCPWFRTRQIHVTAFSSLMRKQLLSLEMIHCVAMPTAPPGCRVFRRPTCARRRAFPTWRKVRCEGRKRGSTFRPVVHCADLFGAGQSAA